MGAQEAPYSDVSECVLGGQGARESVLTDAQKHLAPVEPDDPPLIEKERLSLERMLTDRYGIP